VFGVQVWRRDPPCAWRRNKESLLHSPLTMESAAPSFHGVTAGPPDGTRSARLQDPLGTGHPGVPRDSRGTPRLARVTAGADKDQLKEYSFFFSFLSLFCNVGPVIWGVLLSRRRRPTLSAVPRLLGAAAHPGAAGCAARCGGAGTGCALHCCKNALLVSVRLGNPWELYCWRCEFVGTELRYRRPRT